MASENKNNANVVAYKYNANGKDYIGLRCVIQLKDSSQVTCIVKPLSKDKKSLSKLLYKIFKGLE